MPLAGIVLPTHNELAASEPGRYPRWLPPDELLALAQTWSPKDSPWPYELLESAIGNWEYMSQHLSPTTLLGGDLRGKVIERKMDYIQTADDFWNMVRGSLIHRSLELGHRPGSIAEVKFITHIDGNEFRAIPDLVTPDGGVWDYKSSDNPPIYYPYKSHKRQLEVNRYVLQHAKKWTYHGEPYDLPFNVREMKYKHLTIVYLGPRGPKPMTLEKKQPFVTPKGKRIERNQPYVSTDEEVEEWLLPLIEIFNIAIDAFPKWPKGLEKMSIPDTSGNKKVYPFGGAPEWRCQGKPICSLPSCTAKRYPNGLMWPQEDE